MVLEGLHLPVDQLEPFLDARLTRAERESVLSLIDQRVQTRKPAAYILGKTYIQGVPFIVDERVIVPRSYLGELLFSDLFGGEGFTLVADTAEIGSVLDLCTGSGCLAILAAQVFPNAAVEAGDLSADALAVAALNVAEHDMEGRVALRQGDLFAPFKGRSYDLIITNPPYVDAETMAMLPDEFRAEPALALAGGQDGLDIVRRILKTAPQHLNGGGGLLCEIGTDREILEADFPQVRFLWLDSAESSGEVFWVTKEQLVAGLG
jgi:ribosomal protein L3 glutamine methyltransferase